MLTLAFVREAPPARAKHAASSHLALFRAQIQESVSFARQAGTVRILLVLCVLMGFALNAIEIYWQPALLAYQTPGWVMQSGHGLAMAQTNLYLVNNSVALWVQMY